MASLKTIVATAVIAVGGTAAAFTGLHLGQSPADAATAAQPAKAQAAKAQASYTVTLTAQDLAKLAAMMNGQQTKAPVRTATQHKTEAHHKQTATRHATHQATHQVSYRAASPSSTTSSTTHHSASHSGSGCYDGGHDGGSGHHGEGGGCD